MTGAWVEISAPCTTETSENEKRTARTGKRTVKIDCGTRSTFT